MSYKYQFYDVYILPRKLFFLDSKDVDGNSALHLACEENRVDEAKLLVKNGATTTLMNKQKKTPLDLASPGLVRQLKELQGN